MTQLFIETSDKMLAAIDYTINTYGHEKWFSPALKNVATQYLLRGDDNAEPLKIFRLSNGGYGYTGYHFIIDNIEKYYLSIINVRSYQYLCAFLFFVIIIFIILLFSNNPSANASLNVT